MAEKKTTLTATDKSAELKNAKTALKARVTENAVAQEANHTYVFAFDYAHKLSKPEIKAKVEQEFSVTVTDVRTLTRKGHKTRFSRGKHTYPGTAFKRNKQIAYVTLKDGDSIQLYDKETVNSAATAQEVEKSAENTEKGEK